MSFVFYYSLSVFDIEILNNFKQGQSQNIILKSEPIDLPVFPLCHFSRASFSSLSLGQVWLWSICAGHQLLDNFSMESRCYFELRSAFHSWHCVQQMSRQAEQVWRVPELSHTLTWVLTCNHHFLQEVPFFRGGVVFSLWSPFSIHFKDWAMPQWQLHATLIVYCLVFICLVYCSYMYLLLIQNEVLPTTQHVSEDRKLSLLFSHRRKCLLDWFF